MTSTTKSLMAGFAPLLLMIAMIGLLLVCCPPHSAEAARESKPLARVCFSASKWGPAPDAVRPCVEVTRLFEDGSFSSRVSDADGTTRYTAGVGALDR